MDNVMIISRRKLRGEVFFEIEKDKENRKGAGPWIV